MYEKLFLLYNLFFVWTSIDTVFKLKTTPFSFFSFRLPLKLIKVDKTTGEPLRDENGFCIKCQPNEEGEFIGKIVRGDPVKGIVHLNNYFRLHVCLSAFPSIHHCDSRHTSEFYHVNRS